MVRVEFYGIPRQRAGTAQTEIECAGEVRLGEVFQQVAERFPGWAGECLEEGRLRRGFVANIDGQQFVFDPETMVSAESCVLIMTADAGG